MKARLILLALCGAGLSFAQYTYDYSENPVISDVTRWSSNGSSSYPSLGVTFSGSSPGGSLISIPAISVESGGSQNDYEVNTTLALNSGGGTYIHFLRANSGTVESGSGSYVSVELVIPSSFSGSASATLNVNQCTSGTVTQLGSTTITASNGMTLRSVIFGTSLWIIVNNLVVFTQVVPATAGNPGIGGYNMPSGSGFSGVKLGHHDNVAPSQVNAHPMPSSIFPNSASLQWQGVLDDANGIGLFGYYITRDGAGLGYPQQAEFTDATVQPSTTYTYSISAVDYHGNGSTPTSVTVTTPPAGAVDPRRTGLYSTGSYWGGGGEQIDTLSGNLHFSIPLLTAQGRTGWTIPVSLVYDSQNWRQDAGANWQLGTDVGYGFGWKVLIGSITPYYPTFFSPVDHYVYTDGTGAQYRLDQSNNGIWTSSTQSVYVWLDTTVSPNQLHFSDGSFWVMGSTSGGTEQDAGTMYPTIVEDRFGNQIIVTYDTAAGLPYSDYGIYEYNTSSRILAIDEVRAKAFYGPPHDLPAERASYVFTYDHTSWAIPHITSFTNMIGTPETGTFTFTSGSQEPPFGSDPNYSGATAVFLSSLTTASLQPYQFAYDSAGAGELASVIFPYGGEIGWNYGSFEYIGSRTLREVDARYLAPDALHATSPPWTYGVSRPDAPNSVTVHSGMTLTDASGIGAKTWTFNTGGAAWQIGLASRYTQLTAANGNIMQDDYYTWSQDPTGRPYISAKTSISDEGTGNQQSALTTQTLDQYGNVTQSAIYPYNNTTTPLQTYNNTYVASSTFTPYYIFNLLSTSTVTAGGAPITLASNSFAGFCTYCNYTLPGTEYDANTPVPLSSRAILQYSTTNVRRTSYTYFGWGAVASATGSDGSTATASADSATNYAAPESISVQSYNQTISYTSWLGITSQTGQNGEQLSMIYDSYGRPLRAISPYGAVTSYTYSASAPFTQTESGPNGVTITTLDGFGRTVQVQRGDSATPDSTTSYTATVYAPCACSPMGKQSQVSQPYASGGSASNWTTWTYDGLGRTVSVQQPDGASTTHYAYSGNQTTVTDPAGNWKQFTKDALGNLTTVLEPDPCVIGNTLTTTYTYDWMSHVTGVSLTRPNASYASNGVCSETGSPATQTRTFVYNNAGLMTSATNPENGTVTYTYNSDNTLQYKQDAKGQATVYSYDSLKRLTLVQRYPNGRTYAPDPCQSVTYTYDTNPVNPSFSQYSYGRLTTAQYGCPVSQITNGYYFGQTYPAMYTDMYSYHPAGGVTAKQLVYYGNYVDNNGYEQTSGGNLEADYTFDSAGRVATLLNPATPFQYQTGTGPGGNPIYAPCALSYSYDSMGRSLSVTSTPAVLYCGSWVQGVQYDYAGRLTAMQSLQLSVYLGYGYGSLYVPESRTYNVNGQLSSINGVQYNYPTGQNNGQVSQVIDGLSGETIAYQYDALKRLTSASATPTSGSTPTAWTQTFQYDGFGNLTAKVLNGTSTPIAVNAATNQLTYAYYDGNGNMTSGAGASLTYDVANRLATVNSVSGGLESFQYAPDNKRIVRVLPDGSQELTFYGGRGERLGVFWVEPPDAYNPNYSFTPRGMTLWFGGRIVEDFNNGSAYYENQTAPLVQDRLGTNRTNGARYRPYGEEITSTANDQIKFATYTRDSYSGLDYADQRFYASTYGRFNTPDPYKASGGPSDPGSWNRYAYVEGDPVNQRDPRGLLLEGVSGSLGSYFACVDNNDASGGEFACPINDDDDDGIAGLCGDDLLPEAFCYNRTYAAPPQNGGGGGGGVSPPPPTCDQVLTSEVNVFLQVQEPALLTWDPSLAAQLVTTGLNDGVDPRLMASIAALESGNGTKFSGNNPFGLGPGTIFSSPSSAVATEGLSLEHLIGYGDTSVSKLYSGLPGIINPRHPGQYVQIPGYCQTSVAACQAAGQTISGFLTSFGSAPGVGLTAGNPGNLKFPCP